MGISAAEYSRRLTKLIQGNQIEKKVSDLILKDSGRGLFEAKKNEFEFGLLPDYSKIGLYRNDNYAHRKYLQNPLAGEGNVDLIASGNTVNSLFIKKSGAGYIFDGKYQWRNLLKKYDNSIQSLNQNTFAQTEIKNFLPDLMTFIKQQGIG